MARTAVSSILYTTYTTNKIQTTFKTRYNNFAILNLNGPEF